MLTALRTCGDVGGGGAVLAPKRRAVMGMIGNGAPSPKLPDPPR